MPRPVMGNYDGAVVSGFFIVYSTRNRSCVGDPYDRHEGHLLLWESPETVDRLAKLAAWGERLAGMCGSVQHVEG